MNLYKNNNLILGFLNIYEISISLLFIFSPVQHLNKFEKSV